MDEDHAEFVHLALQLPLPAYEIFRRVEPRESVRHLLRSPTLGAVDAQHHEDEPRRERLHDVNGMCVAGSRSPEAKAAGAAEAGATAVEAAAEEEPAGSWLAGEEFVLPKAAAPAKASALPLQDPMALLAGMKW